MADSVNYENCSYFFNTSLLIHLSWVTDANEVKLHMTIFFWQTNAKSHTQSFHEFNFINVTRFFISYSNSNRFLIKHSPII